MLTYDILLHNLTLEPKAMTVSFEEGEDPIAFLETVVTVAEKDYSVVRFKPIGGGRFLARLEPSPLLSSDLPM